MSYFHDYDDPDPWNHVAGEEPDCFDCMQSRFVAGHWWSWCLVRPCPSCAGGDWWDRFWGRFDAVRWWMGGWWHRLRFHRRNRACPTCTDEAPF